jgi:hypothetical protein
MSRIAANFTAKLENNAVKHISWKKSNSCIKCPKQSEYVINPLIGDQKNHEKRIQICKNLKTARISKYFMIPIYKSFLINLSTLFVVNGPFL